jgi:hypothetical protein
MQPEGIRTRDAVGSKSRKVPMLRVTDIGSPVHEFCASSGHGFWIAPGRESSLAQLKPVLDRFGWRWGRDIGDGLSYAYFPSLASG